jgi:hypothetical protein|tara:strand:+ start:3436 stop:4089 length:654 start_codon:yes stop_codon:yes gene_type:complete
MATENRTYPNSNFAWYNDDNRIAIVCEDTTSVSGESTQEKYDTYQGSGTLTGNITATSTGAGPSVTFTSTAHGLDSFDRVAISGTTSYDGNYGPGQTGQGITVLTADTFSVSGVTNSEANEGAVSGVTWTSLFIDKGLRITYKSKYSTIDAQTEDLKTEAGLDSGLHPAVVCYLKARMFEDMGDIQKAQYFKGMYDKMVKQYPLRKSGVRALSVPRL